MTTDARHIAPFPPQGGGAQDGDGGLSAPRHRQRLTRGGLDCAPRQRREQTRARRRLWEALRTTKMNFRRPAPIGQFVAEVDHYTFSLVIQINSRFRELPERQVADATRTRWLDENGFGVPRFSENPVRDDPMAVGEKIVATTTPPPFPTPSSSRGKGAPRYDVR